MDGLLTDILKIYKQKLSRFQGEFFLVAAQTGSRVSTDPLALESAIASLDGLEPFQAQLLREAVACIRCNLFRAAYVLAWAAFMDFFVSQLERIGFKHIKGLEHFEDKEQLREQVMDSKMLECAYRSKLLSRNQWGSLKGKLSDRNRCAHPSDFSPSAQSAIGYIASILDEIKALRKRLERFASQT